MSTRESLYASRTSEDAEMWCNRCERRHGVNWFAPSEIWNAVMREGDRGKPDEFGFCCPTCFMQLAHERNLATAFVVSAQADIHDQHAHESYLLKEEIAKLRSALEHVAAFDCAMACASLPTMAKCERCIAREALNV